MTQHKPNPLAVPKYHPKAAQLVLDADGIAKPRKNCDHGGLLLTPLEKKALDITVEKAKAAKYQAACVRFDDMPGQPVFVVNMNRAPIWCMILGPGGVCGGYVYPGVTADFNVMAEQSIQHGTVIHHHHAPTEHVHHGTPHKQRIAAAFRRVS